VFLQADALRGRSAVRIGQPVGGRMVRKLDLAMSGNPMTLSFGPEARGGSSSAQVISLHRAHSLPVRRPP
jgi:hypothetical protein